MGRHGPSLRPRNGGTARFKKMYSCVTSLEYKQSSARNQPYLYQRGGKFAPGHCGASQQYAPQVSAGKEVKHREVIWQHTDCITYILEVSLEGNAAHG
jgi:hypothetical protein